MVITNLLEKGQGIDQVLLDLMNDTALIANRSTFIVTVPTETVLDEQVRKQAFVVKPPISTTEERKIIIENLRE